MGGELPPLVPNQEGSPPSVAIPAPVILHQTSEQTVNTSLPVLPDICPYLPGETQPVLNGLPTSHAFSPSLSASFRCGPHHDSVCLHDDTAASSLTESATISPDGCKDVYCVHPDLVLDNRYSKRAAR